MDKKDRELDWRFWNSLKIFDIVINDYKKRKPDGQGDEFIKFLESAREAFTDVHEQWRKNIGNPVVLDARVLAKFLRDVADGVEREAKPYGASTDW